MESATAAANDDGYLGAHLRRTVDRWTYRAPVKVSGLGIGLDMSSYYRSSVSVDLVEEAGAGVLNGLVELIST